MQDKLCSVTFLCVLDFVLLLLSVVFFFNTVHVINFCTLVPSKYFFHMSFLFTHSFSKLSCSSQVSFSFCHPPHCLLTSWLLLYPGLLISYFFLFLSLHVFLCMRCFSQNVSQFSSSYHYHQPTFLVSKSSHLIIKLFLQYSAAKSRLHYNIVQ